MQDRNEKNEVSLHQREQNNVNKQKPEGKNKIVKQENNIFHGYTPTNIGLTFDAEYHIRKKVKTYWNLYYGEEEDINMKDILKDI